MSQDYGQTSAERERTPIGSDECGCPVYPAPEIRGDDADTLVEHGAGCPQLDDGPGHDQHGPHDRGYPGPRGAEYIVDPREMVGLPAPDFGAFASHFAEAVQPLVDQMNSPAVAEVLADQPHGAAEERTTTDEIPAMFRDDPLAVRIYELVRDHDRNPKGSSARGTTKAILAAIADADRRVSHEGATVSALTTERFGPVGGDR